MLIRECNEPAAKSSSEGGSNVSREKVIDKQSCGCKAGNGSVEVGCGRGFLHIGTEPDQAKPDQAKPDQAEPDQAEPDQAESDQAESDQAESDQAKSDQAKSDQAEPDLAEICVGRAGPRARFRYLPKLSLGKVSYGLPGESCQAASPSRNLGHARHAVLE